MKKCTRPFLHDFFYKVVKKSRKVQKSHALLSNSQHLLCGAKGGHSQSQALLGLYYIYGINHEVKKEDGIYWLEISAFQGNLAALEALATIYNFGYRNIPIDLNKAKTYYDYLNMNLKADSIEKYDIYNKVLLTKVKEIGIMHGEDLLCFSST